MSLSLRHGASLDNNPSIQYGSKTIDVSVAANTPIFHAEDVSVPASSGTATLWATGQGGISTFVFGVILSDSDIWVELKNTIGTPQYSLLRIVANVPFYFGLNTSGSTSQKLTGSVVSTTNLAISQIKVQNDGVTTPANVSLYLFN